MGRNGQRSYGKPNVHFSALPHKTLGSNVKRRSSGRLQCPPSCSGVLLAYVHVRSGQSLRPRRSVEGPPSPSRCRRRIASRVPLLSRSRQSLQVGKKGTSISIVLLIDKRDEGV